MAKIGLLRCEKNEDRCPLTGCFKSLETRTQGFAMHDAAELVGVFTCRCPGDDVVALSRILQSKGVDTIHFCTCAFSKKKDGQWVLGDGFCAQLDALCERITAETGIACIKGTAHLPEGYHP